MGEDSRSRPSENEDAEPNFSGLGSRVHDLRGLQHHAVNELSQEVTQLQIEKMQLIQDIANLQARYQTLQNYSPIPEARPIPLEVPAAPLPLITKLGSQSPLQSWAGVCVDLDPSAVDSQCSCQNDHRQPSESAGAVELWRVHSA